jgi:hypothetical protein
MNMEKFGEYKLHEGTQIVQYLWSNKVLQWDNRCKEKKCSQIKLRTETMWKVVYNRKSLMLLMKTTGKDISNACKDRKMSCYKGT